MIIENKLKELISINNSKVRVIFRVVLGIIFGVAAVKYLLSGDYLFGGLFLVCGILFIAQVLLKKKGD